MTPVAVAAVVERLPVWRNRFAVVRFEKLHAQAFPAAPIVVVWKVKVIAQDPEVVVLNDPAMLVELVPNVVEQAPESTGGKLPKPVTVFPHDPAP